MNPRRILTIGAPLLLLVALIACNGKSYNPMSPTATYVPPPAAVNPTPGPTPDPAPVADVVITITGMNGSSSFSPDPASLTQGQTVAWRNADSTVHNISADNGSLATGNIAPGATSVLVTANVTGVIGYHCNIHPTMTGSLSVTKVGGGY